MSPFFSPCNASQSDRRSAGCCHTRFHFQAAFPAQKRGGAPVPPKAECADGSSRIASAEGCLLRGLSDRDTLELRGRDQLLVAQRSLRIFSVPVYGLIAGRSRPPVHSDLGLLRPGRPQGFHCSRGLTCCPRGTYRATCKRPSYVCRGDDTTRQYLFPPSDLRERSPASPRGS